MPVNQHVHLLHNSISPDLSAGIGHPDPDSDRTYNVDLPDHQCNQSEQ